MKTFLPWVIIVVLLGGVYVLYSASKEKDVTLAKQADELVEMDKLRADSDELKKTAGDKQELIRLRKENEEMLTMRSELHRLRDQNKQLTAQLAAVQQKSEQAQQTQQQLSEKLANENVALRGQTEKAARDQEMQATQACIANLRQIDGAKQQWAMDNKKAATDVPTPADLASYLPNMNLIICPAGGSYSINAVNMPPTCSVPGHVLTKVPAQ
ncbi:MAG TPA: hypothetical protein VH413_19595 [Verrucomicrobiae bacterium]|jgi:hypothetical protein|nr:hypothetical protein [Verrucomicrobiae bacterium]